MPSGMRVEVEGIVDLARTFRKIGNEEAAAFLKEANREAATVIARTAKKYVRSRTGRLSDTIRAGGSAKGGVVRAGSSKVLYAGPIHFGWFKRGIKPRPFIFMAVDDEAAQVEEIYHRRLDELLGMVHGADGA